MKHPAALFFTLFFLLAMLLLSITASSASTTPELYDLNSGEEINISKVTAVLDVLSGVGSSSEAMDYNGDGKTDITDVTALLNILAGLVPEEPQSYGLEYTLENGYYVVTGIGTCTDQDIILPNTYDGKPVKAIGQGAFERTEITSIIISSSVTAIEDDAFYRCSALKTVTMTSSITSVGDYAFDRCSALIEVHFDGTKTQWTAIRVGESNEELANATVYYEGIALIEFIDYDESVFDIEEVRIGGSVSAPPEAPHRTNYRFVGWSINGELLPSDFSITVEDNLTIKAVYIRQYTVRFLDHDGTLISESFVDAGSDVSYPTHPDREGYDADGWDKTNISIVADTTITAKYKIKYYEVTFCMPDGRIIGEPQSVAYKHSAEAPDMSEEIFFTLNKTVPGYVRNAAYRFTEWTSDFGSITQNTVVIALFGQRVEETVFALSNAEIVQGTNTAKINLYAINYDADKLIYGLCFNVNYSNLGDYVSLTVNNIQHNSRFEESNYEDTVDAPSGLYSFVWSSGSGIKTNPSEVLTITFNISTLIPAGEYTITLAENSYFVDDGLVKKQPVILNGKITVTE